MVGHLKQFARRFVLMLGGEVLQSAFHFAFNIALVRVLPARDYGLFAIVMLIGGLALTYTRALAGMPASVTVPPRRARPSAAALDVTFGSGASALALLIGIGVAAGLFAWLGSGALWAGAFVGLWSLRSYVRTALFAAQRPVQSTISDMVFSGSGVLLGLLLLRGQDSADILPRVFMVLTLANALAIAVALTLKRSRVRLSFRPSMRRRYRLLAPQLGWSCIGVTTANMQAQGQVLLIALIVGAAAYAPIAATLVFYAPLRLVASALANMMQPELARSVAIGETRRTRQLLVVWTGAMLAVGVICSAATMIALPMIRAPVFEGQPMMLIGSLACGISIVPLLYVMPRILLEVLRRFEVIAVMTSVSGVVGMSVVAVLLLTAGAAWSLVGSLASEVMILIWSWLAVDRPRRTASSPQVEPRPLNAAGHVPRPLANTTR